MPLRVDDVDLSVPTQPPTAEDAAAPAAPIDEAAVALVRPLVDAYAEPGDELRDQMVEAGEEPELEQPPSTGSVSRAVEFEGAARALLHAASDAGDGQMVVPKELIDRLAALGQTERQDAPASLPERERLEREAPPEAPDPRILAAVRRLLGAYPGSLVGEDDAVSYACGLAGLDAGVIELTIAHATATCDSLPTLADFRADCDAMVFIVLNEGFELILAGDAAASESLREAHPDMFWDKTPTADERWADATDYYGAAVARADRLGIPLDKELAHAQCFLDDVARASAEGDAEALAVAQELAAPDLCWVAGRIEKRIAEELSRRVIRRVEQRRMALLAARPAKRTPLTPSVHRRVCGRAPRPSGPSKRSSPPTRGDPSRPGDDDPDEHDHADARRATALVRKARVAR